MIQVRLSKEVEDFLLTQNLIIDKEGDQYISMDAVFVKRAGNNQSGVYEQYSSKDELIIEQKFR